CAGLAAGVALFAAGGFTAGVGLRFVGLGPFALRGVGLGVGTSPLGFALGGGTLLAIGLLLRTLLPLVACLLVACLFALTLRIALLLLRVLSVGATRRLTASARFVLLIC